MKRSRLLIIIAFLVILGFVLAYPFIMNKIENKKLEKEINYVNEYLHNDVDYAVVDKYVKSKNTSLKVLEEALDNYSNKIISNIKALRELNISNFDVSLKENLDNYIKLLEDNKNKFELLKEEYNNIEEYNIEDKELLEKYNKLISSLDKNLIISIYDNMFNDLNNKYDMIKYLRDNIDNYSVIDNKIVFNKRKIYLEFKEKYSNILDSNLINDIEGPVITASDITINKGDKLDINAKIKCVDKVDDNVSCKIDGSYDTNKIGSYEIKITANDEMGNVSEKKIKIIVKEKSKKPYYVEVIRNKNVVIVYGLDGNNKYTRIVKVFVCSVGRNNWTPTGIFTTSDKASWGKMAGGVYAQYYTRIVKDILFHSVPYFTKSKGNLEWEEYNKLGSAASLGCVRLAVIDAKWLYDNLPKGTTIKIYDGELPSGVEKPTSIKLVADNPNKGWDPTDPDKKNPWKK